MRKIAALSFLVLIAISASAAKRRAVRAPSELPESVRLREIIAAAAAGVASQTPAISIAVAHGNGYAEGGFGFIHPERGEVATANSIYWIASATKPFTAALVMQLIEEGRITFDQTIASILPEINKTVTVRQLLEQTAGLAEYTAYLDPFGPVTPQQVIAVVNTKPVRFAAGSSFSYSNTGYYLLGLIVERITGGSWTEAISARIAAPFGLTSTAQCGIWPASPLPIGYSSVTPPVAVAPADPSAPYAAGGLCSSASDLLRFSQLLAAGRIVSAASYALMTTPVRLPNGTTVAYGLGLDLHAEDGRATIGHDGLIPGFQSIFTRYPAEDLTVVVLVNRNGNGLARTVLQDVVRRVLTP